MPNKSTQTMLSAYIKKKEIKSHQHLMIGYVKNYMQKPPTSEAGTVCNFEEIAITESNRVRLLK